MKTSKRSLINANLKTYMRTPALRIEKAQSLYDLLGQTSFGVRCHTGKLSMKIESGYLVKQCYIQGKEES